MTDFQLFLRNEHGRYKYPGSFDASDMKAAHRVASKMTKLLLETDPLWQGWSAEERTNFVIEVADEAGQTVLMLPSRFVGPPRQGSSIGWTAIKGVTPA